MAPDSLPILGRSSVFKNLYFNMGSLSTSFDAYLLNSLTIRDLISADIEGRADIEIDYRMSPQRFSL